MAGDQETLSQTLDESDHDQEEIPTSMKPLVDATSMVSSPSSSSADDDVDDDEDGDLVQDSQLQCEINQINSTRGRSLLKKFFRDFKARRAGIVKALTTDVESFYALCAPGQGNLCLYGLPDETWEVKLPPEYVPTDLPEPLSGINVIRDGMDKQKWLSVVAMHSDSWLLALTSYFGHYLVSEKDYSSQYYREKLFSLINSLPTIHEVVTGRKSDESAAKLPLSRICPDCMSKGARGA